MSRLVPYLVALVIAAVGIAARMLLSPVLGDDLPFITLYAAPVICTWLYGRGPAVLALAISTIGSDYFILQPHFVFNVTKQEYRLGLVLYVAFNVLAIAIIQAMRNAQQAAQRKQADLQAEMTKRLAIEATLARERELFFTTLRSIGDCVITTDLSGQIIFMNEVAVQLTGWPEAEAKGRALESVFRIINQETRAVAPNPVQRVLRDGVIVGLANHTILISRAGNEIPIDDSAAPIRDQDGRIEGVVLVFRDITERYRQAAERQALLVAEQEARQQAEHANRLKDQFLATVEP
jgi:PAS domain S-box-containing protein